MLFLLTILTFFTFYQETSQCYFYKLNYDRQSNQGGLETCLGSETFDDTKYALFSNQTSCYLYNKTELNKLIIQKPQGDNIFFIRQCNENLPSISHTAYYPPETTYEEVSVDKSVKPEFLKNNPKCTNDCYHEGCEYPKSLEDSDSEFKEIEKCFLHEEFHNMLNENIKYERYLLCLPQEKNAIYSEWSNCGKSCTQSKEKKSLSETNDGCKISTMPEKIYQICTGGDCPHPTTQSPISPILLPSNNASS